VEARLPSQPVRTSLDSKKSILITAFRRRYFRTLCRESISRPSGRLSHES